MPATVRNVLAVLAGPVAGMLVNGAIIAASATLVPPPPGVDLSNADGIAKGMHLFQPRHFVMPFLAHALGTFAGAFTAYVVAATYRGAMAYITGAVFLCGGIAASFMIPAPGWFIALDLLLAYIPMAWLAIRLGRRAKAERAL